MPEGRVEQSGEGSVRLGFGHGLRHPLLVQATYTCQ